MKSPFALIALALFLGACASIPTPAERLAAADRLAQSRGWQMARIATGPFVLAAWHPVPLPRSERLTVYIEGDGFAWMSASQPSYDPTPRDPVTLKMALAQPGGNVAYLARPCQFTDAEATGCAMAYWTNRRFADEVVAATDRALDVLKQQAGARSLTLVGYSGGGAVAALVAARRRDVDRLVTVAGNLDHQAWTAHHRVTPLTGSLNPADAADALQRVRQWHFVGARDEVIPPAIAAAYARRFTSRQGLTVLTEPGFDHHCCWAEEWPRLWARLGFDSP